MIEILSKEEQLRLNSFQTWQLGTERLLQHPEIANQLGRLGTQLTIANAESFMPDVLRDGVVCLPPGKASSNGFAVLPYLGEHEAPKLTIDLDLIRPTPNRLALMYRFAAEHGLDQSVVDDVVDAALAVRQSQTTGFLETHSKEHPTFTRPWREVEETTGLTFGGRPTIAVNAIKAPIYTKQPVLQWAEVIHELTHAIDFEAWTGGFPTYPDAAMQEMRGYAAQGVVLDFLIKRKGINAEDYAAYCAGSIVVRSLREKHGWSTEQILNGDFTVTEDHRKSLINPMINAGLL